MEKTSARTPHSNVAPGSQTTMNVETGYYIPHIDDDDPFVRTDDATGQWYEAPFTVYALGPYFWSPIAGATEKSLTITVNSAKAYMYVATDPQGDNEYLIYRIVPQNHLQVQRNIYGLSMENSGQFFARKGENITLEAAAAADDLTGIRYAWAVADIEENAAGAKTFYWAEPGNADEVKGQTGSRLEVTIDRSKRYSCYVTDRYGTVLKINYDIYCFQELSSPLANTTVYVGNTARIECPEAVGPVYYRSGDPSIATVDKNGVVTALRPGKVSFDVYTTDYIEGLKPTTSVCTILISKQRQALTAEPFGRTVATGDSLSISISGAVGKLTFSSADPEKASVTEDGRILAKKEGTVKIYVTAAETNTHLEATKSFNINVYRRNQIIYVSVLKTLQIGSETPITTTDAIGALSYSSEDPSIATVSKDGVIRGVSAGSVQITVTAAGTDRYKEGKRTFTVNVIKPLQTLTAAVPDNKVEITRTAAITTSGAKGALSYISADTSVATVSAKGIVTGKKEGIVRITVTAAETAAYSESSKTFTIRVVKGLQKLSAKAASPTVAVGKTTSVTPAGASGKVTFTSSNTAVATVTSTGKVTAKKVGTTNIRVEAAETSAFKATRVSVTVVVIPACTTSITAENLSSGIKLKWTRVTGATGYDIYRNGHKVGTLKGSIQYMDTGAKTNGAKYVYKIVAYAVVGGKEYRSPLSKSLTTYYMSAPVISSLKNPSAKKLTAKWGKNAKASGYEIQFALKSNFSGAKSKTITSGATVSASMNGLTKGRTWLVRVRAYSTVSGKKYYSPWSAVKRLRVRK